jgi:hypothetical protein
MTPSVSKSQDVSGIGSCEQLSSLLEKHGLPLESWSQGDSKAVEQLYAEVKAGETRLLKTNGRIERHVALVSLEVRYKSTAGEQLCLYEDRQEFGDGRVRCRELGVEGGVSEKIIANEDPKLACVRAIREELGFTPKASPAFVGTRHEQRLSSSYPGLHSHYTIHDFIIELSDSEYKPQGYVEHSETLVSSGQISLNTFFRWRKVS